MNQTQAKLSFSEIVKHSYKYVLIDLIKKGKPVLVTIGNVNHSVIITENVDLLTHLQNLDEIKTDENAAAEAYFKTSNRYNDVFTGISSIDKNKKFKFGLSSIFKSNVNNGTNKNSEASKNTEIREIGVIKLLTATNKHIARDSILIDNGVTGQDWITSCIKTAEIINRQIINHSKNLEFYHDGSSKMFTTNIDGRVSSEFTQFKNLLNKCLPIARTAWTAADIWAFEEKILTKINKTLAVYSKPTSRFMKLDFQNKLTLINNFFNRMIFNNKIFPISLKKIGERAEARVEKINFSSQFGKMEFATDEISCTCNAVYTIPQTRYNFSLLNKGGKKFAKPVVSNDFATFGTLTIVLKNGQKLKVTTRRFSSDAKTVQTDVILDSSPSLGKVDPAALSMLLSSTGIKNFAELPFVFNTKNKTGKNINIKEYIRYAKIINSKLSSSSKKIDMDSFIVTLNIIKNMIETYTNSENKLYKITKSEFEFLSMMSTKLQTIKYYAGMLLAYTKTKKEDVSVFYQILLLAKKASKSSPMQYIVS